MKRFLALVNARNKEFYRDRSALIWSLLFPMIVLLGFTYGYSGRQDPLLRMTVTSNALAEQKSVVDLKKTPGIELLVAPDKTAAFKKLERYQTDLLITDSNAKNSLTYSINADSDKGKLAQRLLLDSFMRNSEALPELLTQETSGKKTRYVDWLLPGLLAMNIMFGSMFGVGYVIVRYRKNGVLKRLRATPLSAFQFLTAQVASRLILMVMTSLIVIAGAIPLIGFRSQGSILDLVLFLSISSIAMISLGLVVAARISSEEVADGILNLMTWPMIFLSGIWFSIEGATRWVVFGAQLMPLTHVVDGLRAILIDGVSISQLYWQVSILLVLSLIFICVASAIFRWR